MRLWILAAGLAATAGCGDQILGVPRDVMVADLEEDDSLALCDEFVALICGDPRGEGFCNDCIRDQLCALPGLISMMGVQCQQVTVGEVRDCIHVREEQLCFTDAGGCMFDVAEMLCRLE